MSDRHSTGGSPGQGGGTRHFSRDQTTVNVECPGSATHDRTRRPHVRGVGLLRLPAACRATFAGWELISGSSDMAGANTAVDGLSLADLKEAITAARNLTGQAASTVDDNTTQPEVFDLAAAVAGLLSARLSQAAPYTDPAQPSCEIYVIPSVAGLAMVGGAILLTMCRLYRDIRTRCNNNTDVINRLKDQPELALKDVKKKVKDCDNRVEAIKQQATVYNHRINRVEQTTKELHGLYGSCHSVASKAYDFLLEQKNKAQQPRGRTQGPFQLEFRAGTKH